MRYRAAAGVGEEAHSRQRHWCPWSKPVNVETCGHVSGPIVMAHALAELRCGMWHASTKTVSNLGVISTKHPLLYARHKDKLATSRPPGTVLGIRKVCIVGLPLNSFFWTVGDCLLV